MNQAGLGVISGELADQSLVQGRGFDSREAGVPIPQAFCFGLPVLLCFSVEESQLYFEVCMAPSFSYG